MSRLATKSLQGLRLRPSLPPSTASPWVAATRLRRYASPNDTKGGFKGQMVQSITQRLERERADLERLGNLGEKKAVGINWSITASKPPPLPPSPAPPANPPPPLAQWSSCSAE